MRVAWIVFLETESKSIATVVITSNCSKSAASAGYKNETWGNLVVLCSDLRHSPVGEKVFSLNTPFRRTRLMALAVLKQLYSRGNIETKTRIK
jgi:hypothetical protein